DVFAFMAKGNTAQEDITGSRITSNKPISVVSGHHCTDIPVGNHWCDYTVEAQLSTETWGTCMHVPMMLGRKFPGIVRIFAKNDKTTIYRDGTQVGFIPKGTGVEGTGWLEMRVVPIEYASRPAVYTADKPFSINFYNPGTQEDGASNISSDPFNMVMTPVEQYQHEISFCTPRNKSNPGDLGFPQN